MRRSGLYERVRKKRRRSQAVVRRQLTKKEYLEYEDRLTLELSPIPCWEKLDSKEIAKRSRALCRQILHDYSHERSRVAKGYRKRLMDRSLFAYWPEGRKTGIRPLVHAATLEEWKSYARNWDAWLHKYQCASARLRQGILEAVHEFPEQAFLPTGIIFRLGISLPPPKTAS